MRPTRNPKSFPKKGLRSTLKYVLEVFLGLRLLRLVSRKVLSGVIWVLGFAGVPGVLIRVSLGPTAPHAACPSAMVARNVSVALARALTCFAYRAFASSLCVRLLQFPWTCNSVQMRRMRSSSCSMAQAYRRLNHYNPKRFVCTPKKLHH